jgi:hypothetical protein
MAHDDLGARHSVLDGGGGVDPAALGHPDVHQHDVGGGLGGDLQRLGAVAGLTDDLDVGLGTQHHLQAAPEKRMVVDDQHPDRFSRGR